MNQSHRDFILSQLQESAQVKLQTGAQAETIEAMARLITDTLRGGNKILLFGNGGSAADAQHMAAELVGHYRRDRAPLAALALTTDSSTLTALSNDYGYEFVFARQVEALASPSDLVVGISTSGSSPSVLEGIAAAKRKGSRTIGATGQGGNRLAEAVDVCLMVPSRDAARIQEVHIAVFHIICDIVEREFPN